MRDLVVLVPGKDDHMALLGILSRCQSIGIREIEYEIYRNGSDTKSLSESHLFLHSMIRQFSHALVVFDREGCGRESMGREALELYVEANLSANGWEGRCAAIVIEPELEAWVWSDSPHVAAALGWNESYADLKNYLEKSGLWPSGDPKPPDPKEAMEKILYLKRKSRSGAIYKKIAEKVSLTRCQDEALVKLRQVLVDWFPVD